MQPKKEPSVDVSLIRRCQAGEAQAFAALFESTKNLVFRTAYLVLGNSLDAEDVLQEVFLQLYRSMGNYDPGRAAFSTWLYRITVNRCLNLRRRRSFFSLPLDELPESALREPALSESQRAEVESVQQALLHLSMKLRVVIVLRYFWDLSNAETAEILNLPIGTVKSRVNLALRCLCKDLQDDLPSSVLSIPEVPK
jgi:RNA polymerase sigma-70 factor, ECF subfamily